MPPEETARTMMLALDVARLLGSSSLVIIREPDADLAALPAPDDTNDRYEVSLPTVTWTAASGNAISKIAVCY